MYEPIEENDGFSTKRKKISVISPSQSPQKKTLTKVPDRKKSSYSFGLSEVQS